MGLVDVFHARMVARVRKLIALKPFVRPAARFSRCVNHVNHSVQADTFIRQLYPPVVGLTQSSPVSLTSKQQQREWLGMLDGQRR